MQLTLFNEKSLIVYFRSCDKMLGVHRLFGRESPKTLKIWTFTIFEFVFSLRLLFCKSLGWKFLHQSKNQNKLSFHWHCMLTLIKLKYVLFSQIFTSSLVIRLVAILFLKGVKGEDSSKTWGFLFLNLLEKNLSWVVVLYSKFRKKFHVAESFDCHQGKYLLNYSYWEYACSGTCKAFFLHWEIFIAH